jgi:hypothetical protein
MQQPPDVKFYSRKLLKTLGQFTTGKSVEKFTTGEALQELI